MATILVTHVADYAGPGIVEALSAAGETVLGHDQSFADPATRAVFEAGAPNRHALTAASIEALHAEVTSGWGVPDGIVANAVWPITPNPVEATPLAELRATFEALIVAPFHLAQLFLPAMKARRAGAFVFITSAREARPEPGFAVPTTIRAGATAFAKALAVEAAPFGVQVNAVAPNYLESEMYYPRARFVDSAEGRAQIAATVPFGRLGRQREAGELVAFLVSGRSPFTTGQVIRFTGGWA